MAGMKPRPLHRCVALRWDNDRVLWWVSLWLLRRVALRCQRWVALWLLRWVSLCCLGWVASSVLGWVPLLWLLWCVANWARGTNGGCDRHSIVVEACGWGVWR